MNLNPNLNLIRAVLINFPPLGGNTLGVINTNFVHMFWDNTLSIRDVTPNTEMCRKAKSINQPKEEEVENQKRFWHVSQNLMRKKIAKIKSR